MVASDRSRLTLRLSVPYATRWGQMVRVVGAGAALGDGNAETSPELACRHVGDRLLWVGEVTVPRAASYTYKYVVVGEGGNVEDEELSTRELQVPAGIAAGALMDVRDEWQVRRGRPPPTGFTRPVVSCCGSMLLTIPLAQRHSLHSQGQMPHSHVAAIGQVHRLETRQRCCALRARASSARSLSLSLSMAT